MKRFLEKHFVQVIHIVSRSLAFRDHFDSMTALHYFDYFKQYLLKQPAKTGS